jgi:hypothetical protein
MEEWLGDRAPLLTFGPEKGLYGINFHRAGVGNFVNKWSAGCQTVTDAHWFEIVKRFNPGDVIAFTLFCTSG